MHTAAPPLATLSAAQRKSALQRFAVLRLHLEDVIPLAQAAREAGVPVRTAQRWLVVYRAGGLAALGRRPRADAGRRRTQAELVALVEGLALTRPRPTVATITRGSRPWPHSGAGRHRPTAPCMRSSPPWARN